MAFTLGGRFLRAAISLLPLESTTYVSANDYGGTLGFANDIPLVLNVLFRYMKRRYDHRQ